MGVGHEFDYDFGQKRHWRRWAWNRIAELCTAEQKQNGLVFYLAGPLNEDASLGMERGFRAENLIAVERNDFLVSKLRKAGQLTVHGDIFSAAVAAIGRREVAAVVADLCSGLSPANSMKINSLLCNPHFEKTIVSVNLLRGREDAAEPRFGAVRAFWAKYPWSFPAPLDALGSGRISAKHRGALAVGGAALVAARQLAIGLQEAGLAATDDAFRTMFVQMLERMTPAFASYRSKKANQTFDSFVCRNTMHGTGVSALKGQLVERPIEECIGGRAGSKVWGGQNGYATVRRSLSAVLAHRTMRMN